MLSSDGLASNNANLALKGILGVRAMAELAAIKMETDASQKYFVCLRSISPYPMLILAAVDTISGNVPSLDKCFVCRRSPTS